MSGSFIPRFDGAVSLFGAMCLLAPLLLGIATSVAGKF